MANRYTRALKQIKDKTLDEKLELLSEIPTNNTAGIFVDTPGTLTPERTEPGDIDSELDLSQDGDGVEGYNGTDTTGLFQEDGTIRAIEPPGDTSYVLGPMMSMWYAWANYTQIGYVRQSDRKMVNLGRITGEMSNWDGVSGFTSYGQLTLEQAVWFKNQSRSDYRAFYPGPPSNPADEFGRYLGSLIDTSKSVLNLVKSIFTPGTQKGFDPSDVFSSLMDKLGEIPGFVTDLINNLGDEGAKLVNGLFDAMYLFDDVKSTLNKAEQTNSILPVGHPLGDPEFPDRPTLVPGSPGSRENPIEQTFSETTNATLTNGVTSDMSPDEVKAQVQKNINTDFNFGAKGTFNNIADTSEKPHVEDGNLILNDTFGFGPDGDLKDRPFLFGGTVGDFAKSVSDDPEVQKDVLTTFDKSVGAFMPGTPGRKDPIVHWKTTIPLPSSAIKNHYEPKGKVLSESRKRILRDIKKPVQVKEIPSKVKVSPKLRNKNKTVGVDMMKIPDTPAQYKPQTNIWSKADYAANVRASQEKKNEVLELVGAAEHHWTYLTEDRRRKQQEKVNEMMSAEFDKQMELLYEKHRIKESKIDKAISAFKKPTDIKPEFPKEPPPKMDPKTGMHPKYGKKYKHDKLDPQSAEAMPPTGDPEIDANIKKATNAKEKARKLKTLVGRIKRG